MLPDQLLILNRAVQEGSGLLASVLLQRSKLLICHSLAAMCMAVCIAVLSLSHKKICMVASRMSMEFAGAVMLGCPCGRTAHSSYANAGQEAPCCTSEPSGLLQVMSWSPCGCCICGILLSQQARPELTPCADMQALEKSVEAGGALDSYEVEGPDRAELLQDLAEFQLATVGPAEDCSSHGLHDIVHQGGICCLPFRARKYALVLCCVQPCHQAQGYVPVTPAASPTASSAECFLLQTLYNALLENNCSEQASRMAAMESSTKNATEMISKLSLQYNRWAGSKFGSLASIYSAAAAFEFC